MQLLHEIPVLDARGDPHRAGASPVSAPTLPPALRALADSGLEDQVEQIKITPEYLQHRGDVQALDRDAAPLPAQRRLRGAVVLIQATQPARSPLPVLSRGPVDPVTAASAASIVVAGLAAAVPDDRRAWPPRTCSQPRRSAPRST